MFPCPRKDKDLLGECQSLAKRMVVVSIIANALVWTCWLVFFRSSVAQSLAERLGLALRLEWPNLALYVVLIIRVASARAADVKAVLGQRSNVNDATEIAIRVLNNTTEVRFCLNLFGCFHEQQSNFCWAFFFVSRLPLPLKEQTRLFCRL